METQQNYPLIQDEEECWDRRAKLQDLKEYWNRRRQLQDVRVRAESITEKGLTKKLLIVEDNQDFARSLTMLLRNKGIEIITARTKREGIEKALQYRPDVVSLDNYMPADENDTETAPYGTEIARAIKQNSPGTFIVGLSTETESFNAKYFDCILNKVKDTGRYASVVMGYINR